MHAYPCTTLFFLLSRGWFITVILLLVAVSSLCGFFLCGFDEGRQEYHLIRSVLEIVAVAVAVAVETVAYLWVVPCLLLFSSSFFFFKASSHDNWPFSFLFHVVFPLVLCFSHPMVFLFFVL